MTLSHFSDGFFISCWYSNFLRVNIALNSEQGLHEVWPFQAKTAQIHLERWILSRTTVARVTCYHHLGNCVDCVGGRFIRGCYTQVELNLLQEVLLLKGSPRSGRTTRREKLCASGGGLRIMIIVVIDKSLEVTDLDLFLSAFTLEQRVQLEKHPVPHWWPTPLHQSTGTEPLRVEVAGVPLEELLNELVALEFIVGDAEDLEGLLAGHKATLDAQALLRHLLTALVTKLLHCWLIGLLVKVLHDLLHALFFCERPDHPGGAFLGICSDLDCSVLCWGIHTSCMLSVGEGYIIKGVSLSSPGWILTADSLVRGYRWVSWYQVRGCLSVNTSMGQ